MAKRKVTYTIDAATVARLEQTAQRLGKPKSQVVREAINDYAARVGRLSEGERLRMLRTFDEVLERIPEDRSVDDVDAELEQIRAARRSRGRHGAGVDEGGAR
jgi:predicted DNA-binding protein